jgi:hypothetical protein
MIVLTPLISQIQERGDILGFLARNFATQRYIGPVLSTILFENNDRGLPATLPVLHPLLVPNKFLLYHSLHHRALNLVQFGLLCVETLSRYQLQLIRVRGSGINMDGADHML